MVSLEFKNTAGILCIFYKVLECFLFYIYNVVFLATKYTRIEVVNKKVEITRKNQNACSPLKCDIQEGQHQKYIPKNPIFVENGLEPNQWHCKIPSVDRATLFTIFVLDKHERHLRKEYTSPRTIKIGRHKL